MCTRRLTARSSSDPAVENKPRVRRAKPTPYDEYGRQPSRGAVWPALVGATSDASPPTTGPKCDVRHDTREPGSGGRMAPPDDRPHSKIRRREMASDAHALPLRPSTTDVQASPTSEGPPVSPAAERNEHDPIARASASSAGTRERRCFSKSRRASLCWKSTVAPPSASDHQRQHHRHATNPTTPITTAAAINSGGRSFRNSSRQCRPSNEHREPTCDASSGNTVSRPHRTTRGHSARAPAAAARQTQGLARRDLRLIERAEENRDNPACSIHRMLRP